jgi:phosphopantetheine adenylyltransferase
MLRRIDQLIEKVVVGIANEQDKTELRELAERRSSMLLPPPPAHYHEHRGKKPW